MCSIFSVTDKATTAIYTLSLHDALPICQGLSKRLPQMDTEQALQLLSTDGMLVKRPILLDGRRVLVGFRQQQWEDWLADTNENTHNS